MGCFANEGRGMIQAEKGDRGEESKNMFGDRQSDEIFEGERINGGIESPAFPRRMPFGLHSRSFVIYGI